MKSYNSLQAQLARTGLILCLLSSLSYASEEWRGAWRLDEGRGNVVKDRSGNTNNGRLIGECNWVRKNKTAVLELKDNTSYIEVPDAASLNFPGAKSMTIEMWLRRPADTRNHILLHKTDDDFGYKIDMADGKLHALYREPQVIQETAPIEIPSNRWCHIAVVRAPTNIVFYYDGEPVREKSCGAMGSVSSSVPLKIGGCLEFESLCIRNKNSDPEWAPGGDPIRICDVRLRARASDRLEIQKDMREHMAILETKKDGNGRESSVTDADKTSWLKKTKIKIRNQLSSFFNKEVRRKHCPEQLIPDETTFVLWRFDEGEGTIAHDVSPVGRNHGKIEGAEWVGGQSGSALEWGEGNGYVVDQPIAFIPTNQSEITLEAWIYLSEYPSGKAPFQSGNILSCGGCYLGIKTNGTLSGTIYAQKWPQEERAPGQGTGPGKRKVPLNQWNHIALSVSMKEKRLALYLNGELDRVARFYDWFCNLKREKLCYNERGAVTVRSYNGSDEKYIGKVDSVMVSAEAKKFGANWSILPGYPEFLWSEHKMLLRPGDDTSSAWTGLEVLFLVPGDKKPAWRKTVSRCQIEKNGWLDYSGLPDGDYNLQIRRIYPDHEEMAYSVFFAKINRAGNRFQVKEGIPYLDGKPFFSLGLCHVRPKDFKLVKEAGFNVVWPLFRDNVNISGRTNIIWQEGEDSTSAMKSAQKLGLLCLEGTWGTGSKSIYEFADRFNAPDKIVFYAIEDEVQYELRHTLNMKYHANRRIVTQIPVFCCQNHATAVDWISPSTDIASMDPYPSPFKVPIEFVVGWTDTIHDTVQGKKPIWMVLEAFGEVSNKTAAIVQQYPVSIPSLRPQSYMALARGARGIHYYAFDDSFCVGKETRGCYLPADLPDLWQGLMALAKELNERQDIWTAPWGKARIKDPRDVLITSRHDYVVDDRRYFIIVNPKDQAVRGKLDVTGQPQIHELLDVFSHKTLSVSGDTLDVEMTPLQVMLLKVNK